MFFTRFVLRHNVIFTIWCTVSKNFSKITLENASGKTHFSSRKITSHPLTSSNSSKREGNKTIIYIKKGCKNFNRPPHLHNQAVNYAQ